MIDEKRIKRFTEGAKKAFKKVDDPTESSGATGDDAGRGPVDAVSLDKLCIWLENNASMYHGTHVSRHAWRQMITSDLKEENTNDAE